MFGSDLCYPISLGRKNHLALVHRKAACRYRVVSSRQNSRSSRRNSKTFLTGEANSIPTLCENLKLTAESNVLRRYSNHHPEHSGLNDEFHISIPQTQVRRRQRERRRLCFTRFQTHSS